MGAASLILPILLPLLIVPLVLFPASRALGLRLAPWTPLAGLILALTAPADPHLDLPGVLLGTSLGLDDTGRLFLLFTALVLFGGTCLGIAAFAAVGSLDLSRLPEALVLVISLLPFGFGILGLWIGMRVLHKRPFSSLIYPLGHFRWGLYALSAGLWLALSAAGDMVLALLQPGNYVFTFEPARFWPYALVAVLLLPVQVAAEELLFRGYLTQGFGLAWGRWAAWLIPAVMFGLLHGFNPEVGAYGLLLMMPIYIGIGLVLGWITLRSAGLEAALGLHLANNLYGTLLVTAPSSALPAPGLFRIQQYDALATLVVFVVMALAFVGLFAFTNGKLERKTEAVIMR